MEVANAIIVPCEPDSFAFRIGTIFTFTTLTALAIAFYMFELSELDFISHYLVEIYSVFGLLYLVYLLYQIWNLVAGGRGRFGIVAFNQDDYEIWSLKKDNSLRNQLMGISRNNMKSLNIFGINDQEQREMTLTLTLKNFKGSSGKAFIVKAPPREYQSVDSLAQGFIRHYKLSHMPQEVGPLVQDSPYFNNSYAPV